MFKALAAALALATAGAAVSAPAATAPMTALEVYEKVLVVQKKQASLECQILRQELKGGVASNAVTGTLKVAAGGKAWLEMTVPSRQLAVTDGSSLFIELSDVKQVMKYDALQLKKSGNFFLDVGSSIKFYAKASLKRLIVPGEGFDEKKIAALELLPLDPQTAGFERMRVWVERDGWLVRQVELKLGEVATRVRFENIKAVTKDQAADGRKTPPAALFRYKAPKGYEVFDLASMQ